MQYDDVKQLSEYLVKSGIKPSFQRVKILERLSSKDDHPTVNTIYLDLIEQIPSLSKTTVYNTLNLFIQHGVARSISVDTNEARYDLITHSHGHFICSKCGMIEDLEINSEIEFSFLKEKGHTTNSVELTVRGVCKNCMNDAK